MCSLITSGPYPDISVILATRNRAEVLRQTLDAFCKLEDPGVPWELVVIDNGSSDDTWATVASFQDRLPVRLVREETPGKVYALNAGIRSSKGRLLVFTDDDITVSPAWLRTYAQAAATLPQVSCFGGLIELDLSACDMPRWARQRSGELQPWLADHLACLDLSQVPAEQVEFYGANVAYRRAVFEQLGLFDTLLGHAGGRLVGGEELWLQRRLRQAGGQFAYLPEAKVWHRIKPEEIRFANRLRRAFFAARGLARVHHLLGQEPRTPVVVIEKLLKFTLAYSWQFVKGLFKSGVGESLGYALRIANTWGYELERLELLRGLQRPWLLRIRPLWAREVLFWKIYSNQMKAFAGLFQNATLEFAPQISLKLMPTDTAHQKIAFLGYYELPVTRRVAEVAKSGGLMVDVGANYGYYSCLWAAAGAKNRVIAFEPSPRVIPALRSNLTNNGLDSQVKVHQIAVGKEAGTLRFTLGPIEQTGWGGLLVHGHNCDDLEVPVVCLDDVFYGSEHKHIDVLKIGTEGADTWILQGSEHLLRSHRVSHIFFEENPDRMSTLGIHPGEAQNLLNSFGYRIESLGEGEWYATI